MATAVGLLDRVSFGELPDNGLRQELSEGRLIEMPPPKWLHGRIAHRIQKLLAEAAGPASTGEPLIEIAYLLGRNPDTVRIPDVSFATKVQLDSTGDFDWVEGPPLLAVEIISPSDSASDLAEKVEQYIRAGCRNVWVVDPAAREVRVHAPGQPASTLRASQLLAAPELFPGWSLSVSRIFSD